MAKFQRIAWRRPTSRWVLASTYVEGEDVIGPLGVVTIKAVGDSPMGEVYRVVGDNGEPYDLIGNQILGRVPSKQFATASQHPSGR